MKPILFLFATLMLTMSFALPSHAQTEPQSIYIDCKSPSGSQNDLKLPRGDGNVWVFQIIPGDSVHWVEGPNWSYPGKGGADPSWGQWNGGDGSLSLSWISPDHAGAFSIGVTGKITCGSGGGGGGEPIDISAMWSGDVLAKDWKPEPAISGGEVAQPAGTDEDHPKEVFPGETVSLAVGEAIDQDTWTQGEDSDQKEDTVHYKWTAGNGGFITDDHPDGDATEVTTAGAQWKAPEELGHYTVTCKIDDEPAVVEDPDTGDRDDDPVTRTVYIKVVVGESSAALKLYKDAELTEEAGDTIGGTVYVALEVTLGKYQKLASNNATLRIEENYDQHSEAERRWDRSVNFDSGWQKKDDSGNWQATEATPQTKNTSDDDEYFRKVWSWPTYSKPLGHNETHTVSMVKVDGGDDTELSFTPTNEDDDGKDGPESVNADVGNLVITDVSTNAGNPDYFLFDSASTKDSLVHPTISFTVKDDGDPHRYKWWVWVKPTRGEQNSVTFHGVMDAPKTQEITINQLSTDYSQDHPLTECGAYTFDIRVQEIKDTVDADYAGPWIDYRSTKLTISESQHDIEFTYDFDNNTEYMSASYLLEGSKDASEMAVTVIDPALDKKNEKQVSGEVGVLHQNVTVYTFTANDLSGIWTSIFHGTDDCGDEYRIMQIND